MADFPSALAQGMESEEYWIDPMLTSRARGGGFKGRRLQSAKKRGFTVRLNKLTPDERATLETFYDANRATTFNFAWNDSLTDVWIVAFADRDAITWRRAGPDIWDADVRLEEA